jgi:hypothetical protein
MFPEKVKLPLDTIAPFVNDAPLSVGLEPKLTRLELTTVEFNVVPVNVPALAATTGIVAQLTADPSVVKNFPP